MKKFIILFVILSIITITLYLTVADKEPDPIASFEKLSQLNNAKDIYNGLIELRNESRQLEKWLINEKSYRPDDFYFASSIESILQDLPENFEDKPSCSGFLDDLLRDYRVKELSELPDLDISVYQIYEKTCEEL